MSAYTKIRKAMLARERALLADIKHANRSGYGQKFAYGFGTAASYNAIDRLIAKGLVRVRQQNSPSGYGKSGYWATALLK